MHLAAESHVDRSITSAAEFINTNIHGTYTLLEVANEYSQKPFKFVYISTDEVWGSLDFNDPPFSEKSQYQPNSPYSASKAAGDHLVRAWYKTYKLETMITHCSNNYGIQQLPEKLIPNTIFRAFDRKKIPVYGTGDNIRDWIHVDDHCRALLTVLEKGKPGEMYDVGADNEWSNIELVIKICDTIDALLKDKEKKGDPRRDLIEFVEDRKGHDKRYAIDYSKIKNELGWQPTVDFEEGLKNTIIWYLNHRDYWL
jgi:dTDP-glucose 4,6-dehydratase